MADEQIITTLTNKYAAPLPAFYSRRIVVFADAEKDFAGEIDAIGRALADASPRGVRLIKLTGSNYFAAKKTIYRDDTAHDLLLYVPFALEDAAWLMDVTLYSEVFRADAIALRLSEMGLAQTKGMRRTAGQLAKFFNAKSRRDKIAARAGDITSEKELVLAAMAVLTGSETLDFAEICCRVLSAGWDDNPLYEALEKYGLSAPFWQMAAALTGYADVDARLKDLCLTLFVTAAQNATPMTAFAPYADGEHIAACYDALGAWIKADADAFYRVARQVEAALSLPDYFVKLSDADIGQIERLAFFPCVNEVLLSRLFGDVAADAIDTDVIRRVVDSRRALAWYDVMAPYYDGLLAICDMAEYMRRHETGFHETSAKALFETYAKDAYRMDTYYRTFRQKLSRALIDDVLNLDDAYKAAAKTAERLYGDYLDKLAAQWTRVSEDAFAAGDGIFGVTPQTDFYNAYVRPQKNRVFVIISDAMRYEVAATLAQTLTQKTQAEVKLTAMLGTFPTATPFGMAALLPHRRITWEKNAATGGLNVLCDGMLSAGTPARDAILKQANPGSVALQYTDVIKMSREERQDAVRGMAVVYIYHDTIDRAGHDGDPFAACETAISEIVGLVRIIANDLGGTTVMITADHGFLYTGTPLAEADKLSIADIKGDILAASRRYVLADADRGLKLDALMPVACVDPRYDGFTPRENIRLKIAGSDGSFVHGGVSLQEICVPVIAYHFLRNSNKTYQRDKARYDTKPVGLTLYSSARTIYNRVFSLNFYQTEAALDNRVPATYDLVFTDASGLEISDRKTIIADKTDRSEADRTFRLTFTLQGKGYAPTQDYYLVIKERSGRLAPEKIAFRINISVDFGGVNSVDMRV